VSTSYREFPSRPVPSFDVRSDIDLPYCHTYYNISHLNPPPSSHIEHHCSMLLSIPSCFDAGYPSEQHEDVQIEISLDNVHNVFMIMVTSQEYNIQSVVAVPKMAARKSPRSRKSKTQNSVSGLPPKFPQAEIVAKPTERGRRADYMRPSSPLGRGRSSAIESRNNSGSRKSRSRKTVIPRQRSASSRDESVPLRRSSSMRSSAPLSDNHALCLTDRHCTVENRPPNSREDVAPRQRRETRMDESVCLRRSSSMGSRQSSSSMISPQVTNERHNADSRPRAESRPRTSQLFVRVDP
jgi:hypothetical protein